MNRRSFLRFLTAGSLATLLPGLCIGNQQRVASSPPGENLLHALKQNGSPPIPPRERDKIGEAYLKACPEDGKHQNLRRALLDSVSSSSPQSQEDISCWRRRIRTDFTQGDTICLRGWILSRTEARLYALLSLS